MKFVLFLIKTLSLILCIGLLGAYFYYTFLAEVKSQFMANASLLLFVLSAVVTSLTIVLSENKIKSTPATGIDAYLAELRKEEKNTAKQIQNALPKDLLPMLEKAVAAISENKEAMNTTLLDSKTAFSSALSENKNTLSSLLNENQSAINASVTEGMRLLDAKISENNNSFGATLSNLLEQVTALANKNTAPINLALENINARLDDLENKIVNNRIGSLSSESDNFEVQNTSSDEGSTPSLDTNAASEAVTETYNFAGKEEPEAAQSTADTDTSGYDFSAWNTEPETATETKDETYDFTAPKESETAQNTPDTSGYDFSAWDTEPTATPETDTSNELNAAQSDTKELNESLSTDDSAWQFPPIDNEPNFNESISEYANALEPNSQTDQRDAFDNDLSGLADLEIMQEPVAPTADPKYDEIDIDEFLKGRTDLKN